MPAYFDSSVLLAILKGDQSALVAADLWQSHSERVSSILMEAECLTVLRRVFHQATARLTKNWLDQQTARLQNYLEELSLQRVDEGVMKVLYEQEKLSDCRTLDALHVATALLFRQAAPDDFYFCTFDMKMADVARSVGLVVLPKD